MASWFAAWLTSAVLLAATAPAPLVDVNAQEPDGTTALHRAAQVGDLAKAKALIEAGASAKAENRYGVTPLSLACVTGSLPLVKLLLDAGANPNAALRGGETALMTAARTGLAGPVKALLARGAKVNSKEQSGQTALMWAAAEGHLAVVETLLTAGADFRTPLVDSGFTPLGFAVREGRTEVTRALLEAGADVNETMKPRKASDRGPRAGMSPLLLAVENGHFELAAMLLDAGADPNDQRGGFTALHTLTWVRKPDRGDGEDGDPAPTGSGKLTSLDFARVLVSRGANVNARLQTGKSGKNSLTRKGATPFLLAAARADLAYMKLLVELGADASLANAENSTPLLAAMGVGVGAPEEAAGTEPEVLETLRFLLSIGADLNVVDDNGETVMHGAAYRSHPKVVHALAKAGAKVSTWNAKNKRGWTPLLIAEGYRSGNFRPSPDTQAALRKVMLEAGVTPPASTPPAMSRTSYP